MMIRISVPSPTPMYKMSSLRSSADRCPEKYSAPTERNEQRGGQVPFDHVTLVEASRVTTLAR